MNIKTGVHLRIILKATRFLWHHEKFKTSCCVLHSKFVECE